MPPPRLRLRVTAAAENIIRSGHPWLFASSVRDQNREGALGELAVIYDRANRFLGIGLFDPNSPLRVRMLHVGRPLTLDDAWWQMRLEEAMARRRALFDSQTDGWRWICGESDGWPGLALDRYRSILALKLYTAAWLPRLEQLTSLFRSVLQPDGIVLRLSRNIQEKAKEFGVRDGQVIFGKELDMPVIFQENGIRFEADVVRGQKTGFFLDQRENRRRVELLSQGRDVLNAFSFSGGFSLYAARGGAKSVTDLDISAHAIESAQRNFALNQAIPQIAQCRHETLQGDVFAWLQRNTTQRFDLIILDPPSLAKREAERTGAIRAYGSLAAGGIKLLRDGGVLVAASCSAHVSAPEFFGAVRQAVQRSARSFTEIKTTGHPPDHPATFGEAAYLKCIYTLNG